MNSTTTRFLMLLTTSTATTTKTPCPALLRLSRHHHRRLLHSYSSFLNPHYGNVCLSVPDSRPTRPIKPSTTTTSCHQLHTASSVHPAKATHQLWPEWSNFVQSLSANGYFNGPGLEEMVSQMDSGAYDLPQDFVRSASACFAFARARDDIFGLLSRRDIEVVVQNATPFLFKNCDESSRRLRLFLSCGYDNAVNADRGYMVDLMKYLLSCASSVVSAEMTHLCNSELVHSSTRHLLNELAELSSNASAPNLNGSVQNQFPGRYGHAPMSFGQNIEMKRGDWFCPRCNFMNFARNMKCLECEEARPQRQLTGGEWECPQCDFFNYGRNMVCLRCDCKRPGEVPYGSIHSTASGSGNQTARSDYHATATRLAANEEKAQRWFSKVSQVDGTSDMNNAIKDDDFPEIMPLRKGVNRFVVSTRKTRLERKLANAEYQGNLGNNSTLEGDNSQVQSAISETKSDYKDDEKTAPWFKRISELHNFRDVAGASSENEFSEMMPVRKGENQFVVSKRKDRSLTSPMYKRSVAMEQANNNNFVPFVPLPPDYFGKKDTDGTLNSAATGGSQQTAQSVSESWNRKSSGEMPNVTGNSTQNVTDSHHNSSSYSSDTNVSGTQDTTGNSQPQEVISTHKNSSDIHNNDATITTGSTSQTSAWGGKSLEGSAVKELPDPLDMSEEAKAERWFRRVAHIKDISELSEIPDEDFPSIMPMRKGVNRFVVSKRKTPLERRLTSTQYRRNLPVVSSDPVKENDKS